MKQYFNHIQSKPPHERRQHALQVASIFTALVFVVWITTLGVRLASSNGTVVNAGSDAAQVAGAAAYGGGDNTLEVASTTPVNTSGYTLPYAQ